MKVAVVGCGTIGPVAAMLLTRDGHDVTIFERVAEPTGVGAGILLQQLGQRVLAELGLADELERRSSPVRRVDARTPSGRKVLDFAFDDVVPGAYGWGVHRGALFDLLWGAVNRGRHPGPDRRRGRRARSERGWLAAPDGRRASSVRSTSSSPPTAPDPGSGG